MTTQTTITSTGGTSTGGTSTGDTSTSATRSSTATGSSIPVPVDYVDGAPLDPTDPRVALARSVQVAGVAVAHLTAGSAGAATPCNDWTASELALHIVGALHRLAAVPGGADITAPETSDETVGASIGDGPDDLSRALDRAARALEEAWSDPELLGRTMRLPFAELPGAATLGIFTAEFLTHAWDLSVSIGIDPEWYDPDVEMALAMLQQGLPDEPRGGEMPFGPVVETSDNDRPIDRLVAWSGRNPARPVG